jgi:low affinity Fe/Cu permease
MCSHVTSGVPQGTVLGPTLFLVFINDIADNLHSTARVFADDCVIYRPINTEQDHQLMQEDLDPLVGWSDTWQMEFNVSKCAIMQTTNKRSKTDFPYKMKGETTKS